MAEVEETEEERRRRLAASFPAPKPMPGAIQPPLPPGSLQPKPPVQGSMATPPPGAPGGIVGGSPAPINRPGYVPPPALPPEPPKPTEGDIAAANAASTADKVEKEFDEGKGRKTVAPPVVPTTTGPVTVGGAPQVTVGPVSSAVAGGPRAGLGGRIAGSGDDAQLAGPAVGVGPTTIAKDSPYNDLQRQAAEEIFAAMRGERPSKAVLEGRAAADRIAAEQLSEAAGAQGQSVASARRNAAMNIRLGQQEAAAREAELVADEMARARGEAAQISTAGRGQDIDLSKAQAELTSREGMFNAAEHNKRDSENRQARETAIQAFRERFAKGEITETQLASEIEKANAEFKQRSIELYSKLQAEAAAGNRDAQVELQKLQAQIDADLGKFNAKQLQDASLADAENFLKAQQIDDKFITDLRSAWLEAEKNGDQAALENLRIKAMLEVARIQKSMSFYDKMEFWLGGLSKTATGFAVGASDRRAKTNIKEVSGYDLDAFIDALGKGYEYDYKDPERFGEGRRAGPMAQDVEKSELGASAVEEDDDGTKLMDFRRLAALALMGLGRVGKRLKDLEGGR